MRERPIRVRQYEEPALIARWIQQLTSVLEEYVKKLDFCHNDLHASNCLLDGGFNLKLADFGRATTIGQPLEGTLPPPARPILAGPLRGTYGLRSARTEQFAIGKLLYFMVYGHEPYDDFILRSAAWDRRLGEIEFPELNRNEVFDGLISACWYNVYPIKALLAYGFKRKTNDMIRNGDCTFIDSAKDINTCEGLVRRGLLGPELAPRFQPAWRRYLHSIMYWCRSVWQCFL